MTSDIRRSEGKAATGRPRRPVQFLSQAALKTGLHIVAGPGSGKSRLMGRVIAPQAFVQGSSTVVFDPGGGLIDNIVDKFGRLPYASRKQVWSRLVYVDAGATDFIVPTPLYYRSGASDTLFEIANRLPAVFKRQDPQLQSAPILGWNSLFQSAIYSGQIAAALGRQIDFVADLIAQPGVYKEDLRRILAQLPELEPAVSYFREMMDRNNPGLRERRTGSFSTKLLPFLADPSMLATFAAAERRVDWEEVVAKRQMVLVDFRHELDPERRQFKLIWWFRSFIDYVKQRGMAGRGKEIYLIIDEISQLTGQRTGDGHSILAEDLEELVAVLARNYGINVVLAHQNLSQVDERIRNVLMQCGTQVVGAISNPDDADFLARQLFCFDPYKVKKEEPVWMALTIPNSYGGFPQPQIIDYRTVEFTGEEQVLQAAAAFRLPRFNFLIRPATAEGTISNQVYRISLENLDKNQYPDADRVAKVLALLRQKCGVPVETLLAEIRARRPGDAGTGQKRVKKEELPAILNASSNQDNEKGSTSAHKPTDDHAVPRACADEDATSANAQGARDDEFWR